MSAINRTILVDIGNFDKEYTAYLDSALGEEFPKVRFEKGVFHVGGKKLADRALSDWMKTLNINGLFSHVGFVAHTTGIRNSVLGIDLVGNEQNLKNKIDVSLGYDYSMTESVPCFIFKIDGGGYDDFHSSPFHFMVNFAVEGSTLKIVVEPDDYDFKEENVFEKSLNGDNPWFASEPFSTAEFNERFLMMLDAIESRIVEALQGEFSVRGSTHTVRALSEITAPFDKQRFMDELKTRPEFARYCKIDIDAGEAYLMKGDDIQHTVSLQPAFSQNIRDYDALMRLGVNFFSRWNLENFIVFSEEEYKTLFLTSPTMTV